MQWQWVINAKDVAQLAQAIVAAGAIIIAAWLFWQRLKPYPRLKVMQSLSSNPIHGNKRPLRVAVTFENLGGRLFRPKGAYLQVQQIHPAHPDIVAGLQALDPSCCLADAELSWPTIASTHLTRITELEPGNQESHYCDFLIDPTIEVVAVYSRVENPAKKEKNGKSTGWNPYLAEVSHTTHVWPLHEPADACRTRARPRAWVPPRAASGKGRPGTHERLPPTVHRPSR